MRSETVTIGGREKQEEVRYCTHRTICGSHGCRSSARAKTTKPNPIILVFVRVVFVLIFQPSSSQFKRWADVKKREASASLRRPPLNDRSLPRIDQSGITVSDCYCYLRCGCCCWWTALPPCWHYRCHWSTRRCLTKPSCCSRSPECWRWHPRHLRVAGCQQHCCCWH